MHSPSAGAAADSLQKGVGAIFGPQLEAASMHVQSICDDLEVPHIEARWEYRLMRDQLSINLYPRPSILSEAFVRLVNAWNWKDFIIIYEEDDAIIRLKDFMKEGEKQKWKMQIYQFQNDSYRDMFWEIKRAVASREKPDSIVEYRIILDVPRKNLYDVFKAAQQVGMMTEHQKYLITSLDLHTIDMEDFQYGKTNITGLRLAGAEEKGSNHDTLKTESTLIYDGVKLFASSLEQMDLAKNVSVLPPISCTLMNKGIDGTTLFNFMKNAALPSPGLSGMIEFDAEGFRSRISLDVIYLTASGLTKIGTIVPSKKGEWSINIVPPEYPSDFQFVELENSNFRVTTKLTDPYVMYRESAKKKCLATSALKDTRLIC
ncbi:glutamate receptor ionotropic, kainate 3 [Caerostris extrusa]|uniref:Glutamate receptor ionotropic, kainate 3 n=1 Tax=Caerostris extrusa TaxID=172846 RepID=A0AAV4P8T8_CAEEX|nr:glutamate receptor ionotropic, kainate 3 [Caerostris extrusa]